MTPEDLQKLAENYAKPYPCTTETKLCCNHDIVSAFKAGYAQGKERIEKLEKALRRAEQFMVTTNLERARSRGDYQAVSEALRSET